MPELEPHKQPPHEKRMGLGVELHTKTCTSCGKEVLVNMQEISDEKVVRILCNIYYETKTDNGMELVR
jgi:hypothetical protein